MKKIGIKKMAPRISEKTFEFLAENFQSANYGAELLLNNFPDLFLLTLRRELAGQFTAGELSFLICIYNGTILGPALGQILIAQVEDSFTIYPDMHEEKWGVTRDEIVDKIKSLTTFQAACLEIWANSFWYGGRSDKNERDLREYIKTLI